jgi:hypothetical protein
MAFMYGNALIAMIGVPALAGFPGSLSPHRPPPIWQIDLQKYDIGREHVLL